MNKPIFCMALFVLLYAQARVAPIKPQLIVKNTTINLTEDIIINSRTTPIAAAREFGGKGPEKIIFTSKTGNRIIVGETGIWDLTTFNSKHKIIEFRGNAKLVCKPGARMLFNNGLLRFCESSQWIIS